MRPCEITRRRPPSILRRTGSIDDCILVLLVHRVYHCDTCDQDGEGECPVCGAALGGNYGSAVIPDTCFECHTSFEERAIDGVEYQCPK
jgi:hypothetical protein